MKIKNSIVSLAACAAVIAFAGCSKSAAPAPGGSASPTPAADAATAPAANAATAVTDAAKDVAGKAADTAKDVAGQAAAAVTTAVTTAAVATNAAVTAATSQFTDIVGQAKSYIADKKYTQALDILNKLSGVVLSADQQKTVDDLKAQVQKLVAGTGGAVDAAKNLLGK
jgi:hypothetical protein